MVTVESVVFWSWMHDGWLLRCRRRYVGFVLFLPLETWNARMDGEHSLPLHVMLGAAGSWRAVDHWSQSAVYRASRPLPHCCKQRRYFRLIPDHMQHYDLYRPFGETACDAQATPVGT